MLPVKLLSLGDRRNRGKVAEVVVFTAIGDGFQVFRIPAVSDADACDLSLLRHGNGFRFGNEGFTGQHCIL